MISKPDMVCHRNTFFLMGITAQDLINFLNFTGMKCSWILSREILRENWQNLKEPE